MAPCTAKAAVTGTAVAGTPKHRACDECRFRKIACSKEPDGCSRCRNEGIRCVYSPQKRMGRPRKRRHVDTEESPATSSVGTSCTSASVTSSCSEAQASTIASTPPMACADPSDSVPPLETASLLPPTADDGSEANEQLSFPTDSSFEFSDPCTDSSVSFIDMLPDDPLDFPNIFNTDDTSFVHFSNNQDLHSGSSFSSFPMNGAELLDGIKFDDPDPSMMTVSDDIKLTVQHFVANQFAQMSEHAESSSENDSNCLEVLDTPPQTAPMPTMPKPNPTSNCSCLSSLYMALDSVAHLPYDIPAAMRITRNATKIALEVISCPYCYDNLHEVHKPPPMTGFQNVMCLAALVPSACNAYATIMQMVNTEIQRAKEQGSLMWFSFKDFGGLWGSLVVEDENDTIECRTIKSYNNKYLSPDVWGTAVRSMLKVDVYGFPQPEQEILAGSAAPKCGVLRQLGLKDVVTMMDEKNHSRHDRLDKLIESGQLPANSPYLLPGGYRRCPPEERSCVRMLDMARTALSNLVIS